MDKKVVYEFSETKETYLIGFGWFKDIILAVSNPDILPASCVTDMFEAVVNGEAVVALENGGVFRAAFQGEKPIPETDLRWQIPPFKKRVGVSRQEFEKVMEALWDEIEYQDKLSRRTDDEAKDIPGFATLGRRYLRKLEDAWADNPGVGTPSQVPQAQHALRKLAAIFVRGMAYTGVRTRKEEESMKKKASCIPERDYGG
jgi:hypothetical protein